MRRTRRATSPEPINSATWPGLTCRKGRLVYLESKLKTRHYDDAAGQRHYVTEVVGDHLLLLDKKSDHHPADA